MDDFGFREIVCIFNKSIHAVRNNLRLGGKGNIQDGCQNCCQTFNLFSDVSKPIAESQLMLKSSKSTEGDASKDR